MKRIIVLIGLIAGLAVLVTGAAVALTDDDPEGVQDLVQAREDETTEAPDTGAPESEAPDEDEPAVEKQSFLRDVLDDLVADGVITTDQADIIEDRIHAAKEELWDEKHDGRKPGFHFRFKDLHPEQFPEGFELPEGFEFPEGFPEDFEFEFRGPIDVPEEVREQLDQLLDSLDDELEVPFGGRVFRFPGSSLREFLEDGQLSQDELDQLESELREMAEQFEQKREEWKNERNDA